EWLEMDEKTRKFDQAQPNLVMRTVLFSRAVEDFLQSNGIPPSTLEETLILTNPGVDITTNDPAARIVLIDALNRFVQNIKNSPPLLGNFQIAEIVALFEQTHKQMETAASESRQSPFDFLTNIKLSTAQWIILGLVLAFNAIAVLIFIAFMITNN
ncbi:MAG: hypothetical protein ACE5GO_06680, partial [Anaerolineales bacterium]